MMLIQTSQIISGPASTDKRASQILMQKIHNTFSDFFSGSGCFDGTFSLQVKDGSWPYQASPKESSICTPGIPQGGTKQITKATNNSTPGHG